MNHKKRKADLQLQLINRQKEVTCVTNTTYNIAQDKEKIKYFIDSVR